jgi:huntingtin
LERQENFTTLSNLIDSLFLFASTVLKPIDSWILPEETANMLLEPNFREARDTCMKLCRLLSFVLEGRDYLTEKYLRPIILNLSRIAEVNAYVMVPPIIWNKNLWMPNFIGDFKTVCPTVPSEELRDPDILRQFTDRIHALGWISRIQFEEFWMSLLGVISLLQQESSHDGNFDDCDISCISIIAIEGLVDLLMQTFLTPSPGNPVVSVYVSTKDEKAPFFIHTKFGQKLMALKETISSLEQPSYLKHTHEVGHVSIFSLHQIISPITPTSSSSSASSSTTTSPLAPKNTTQDIDLHSCVHFLFDLLHQLTNSKTSAPMMVTVIDAFISLSDLFFERNQFEKLLETFCAMYKHAVQQEDEEQLQALTLGIIKCASVMSRLPEASTEKVKKCVENGLKSNFLVCRIKTLMGIKHYLMECPELMKAVTPSLSEYLVKHLGDTSLSSSKNVNHVTLMWDISFLLVEKFVDDFSQSEFGRRIFTLALEVVSQPMTESSIQIKKKVVENLERLTLNEVFAIKDADLISKSCLERLKNSSPSDETAAFSLLLTTLYVFGLTITTDHSAAEDPLSHRNSDEDMLEAMEKIAILFDRLKVCSPHEAKVISFALPSLLVDFFPTQDILNKVIGEFVSSQQLYPHLLADVVFAVFGFLRQESKGDIIHEWVMLSLSSFPQLDPLPLSVWSLTCFLICASDDHWIKSL